MSASSDLFFVLENTERKNCHNENMTKPFDYLVDKDGVKTSDFDDTGSFIDMNTCF